MSQAGDTRPALEKPMMKEQIGGPEIHNKAKRFRLAVWNGLDRPARSDQLNTFRKQIGGWVDDPFQRLAIESVENYTFGSAGTQGDKPI